MKKIFLLSVLVALLTSCYKDHDPWFDPVTPVDLIGIQAVNVDNSGEFPIVISDSSVKKEAYMIGVKWQTAQTPNDDDDIFITDPIQKGEQMYSSLGSYYSKAIKCNTAFNSTIPAGKYVSKFFKEMDFKYLPADVDEGFVLLTAPAPGVHSFRVEYYEGNRLKFYYDTPEINFY